MLRVVGERIVTKLRSQLFRKTYVQNAEFFDANRVGDLISRLSSDTIIVAKSITQNFSDGLRALVTGTAGLGLMAYVSLKLTVSAWHLRLAFISLIILGTFDDHVPTDCSDSLCIRSFDSKSIPENTTQLRYIIKDCRREVIKCQNITGFCWRSSGSIKVQPSS